ncbi:MAG: ATP-dependent DNA helicase RecQ [Acidimicrobiia bacterium]|nr:ATP-dependent DNA helicase RecQ [Acidimicrobiia bacterium]
MTEELRLLAREVARTAFGFEELRPGQEEAVAGVLGGRDVLAVLPTGSGKSAIYQLAGALIDGPTIVVSPLIALQQDQVDAIGGRLGGAIQVNSSLGVRDRREALDLVKEGGVEFVFVAPEQLANDESFSHLSAARPSIVVIDEAHCISSWGHDFRPDYLRLGDFIERLGRPPVLALTATASPPVRRDIIERLRMRDPLEIVRGFERPNISLAVEAYPASEEADAALLETAEQTPGSGIVYVATRRRAEDFAEALTARGRAASAYHAGLKATERDEVHHRFLDDEGAIVVATIAFGMGIDAPHVRFVLHADPPESLDAYYQEFGRAGRDGEPASARLFNVLAESGRRRFFAGLGELTEGELQSVVDAADPTDGESDFDALVEATGLSSTSLSNAVDLLSAVGALRLTDRTIEPASEISADGVIEAALEVQETRRAFERTRGEMMERYLATSACRWQTILAYFGEPTEERCGRCDNCRRGSADVAVEQPWPLETRVRHPEFGVGMVIDYEGDTVTVLFDEGGYRTLAVPLVLERELLVAADE